jgi:hypothetical protein
LDWARTYYLQPEGHERLRPRAATDPHLTLTGTLTQRSATGNGTRCPREHRLLLNAGACARIRRIPAVSAIQRSAGGAATSTARASC